MAYSKWITIPACTFLLTIWNCAEDRSELILTRTHGRGAALVSVMDTALATAESQLPRLISRLRSARKVWEIGTAEGPPESRWGRVTDAAVDSRGWLYVLDKMNVEVRVFAPDGTYERSFLRDGRGPLEMREPMGIEITDTDSVVVYSTAEVNVVASKQGADFDVEARRFALPSGTDDLCVGPEGLLARVASPRLDGIIEHVDMTGKSLNRFGRMDAHPDPLVRAQLSIGSLECGGAEPWVVAASEDGPVIRAYSVSGDSLWTSEVAEFRQAEILAVGVEGNLGIHRPGEKPSDRVLAVVRVPGEESLILQVARIGPAVEERGRRFWRIERTDSFLLSANTGEGRFISDDLPHLLTVTASTLVGLRSDRDTGTLRLVVYEW